MVKFNRGLGIMSGTSLDGLDIAEVAFLTNPGGKDSFKIISAQTYRYPKEIASLLSSAPQLDGTNLQKSEITYTRFVAQKVNQFLDDKEEVNFIGCHGHTVFHNPNEGYTYQMIDGGLLASSTGIRTVCDFRSTDLALGGQGAPLVPIGDEILFSQYAACLNLGGFANISFKSSGKRKAFDICPVNIVLNEIALRLGLEYDEGGKMARSTAPDGSLLEILNSNAFYSMTGPRSLGREWVESNISNLLKGNPKILLATFTEHAALQIGKIISREVPSGDVLCSGGGVHNHFLIERISLHAKRNLFIPSKEIIDFKEALIFALLGKLRLEENTNCLSAVTGAERNSCSGAVYLP